MTQEQQTMLTLTPCFVESDLDLHWLLRPVCSNTWDVNNIFFPVLQKCIPSIHWDSEKHNSMNAGSGVACDYPAWCSGQ